MAKAKRKKKDVFQYIVKVPEKTALPLSKVIAKKTKEIEALYNTTVGKSLESETVLKLGKVTVRPRSIAIEIPAGIRLNVLSDVMRTHLAGLPVQIPFWS